MRQNWTLQAIAMILLGVLGCQHQPDLKPPEQPQVLATPPDPRYARDARYPSAAMDSDPLKMKLQQDNMMNAKGGGRPGSMSMGGGMP